MTTRVYVREKGAALVLEFTPTEPVTFERLRAMFEGPMRITHDLVRDCWYVDLWSLQPAPEHA